MVIILGFSHNDLNDSLDSFTVTWKIIWIQRKLSWMSEIKLFSKLRTPFSFSQSFFHLSKCSILTRHSGCSGEKTSHSESKSIFEKHSRTTLRILLTAESTTESAYTIARNKESFHSMCRSNYKFPNWNLIQTSFLCVTLCLEKYFMLIIF